MSTRHIRVVRDKCSRMQKCADVCSKIVLNVALGAVVERATTRECAVRDDDERTRRATRDTANGRTRERISRASAYGTHRTRRTLSARRKERRKHGHRGLF